MNVGICYVTGREGLKDLTKTYAQNWLHAGLVEDPKINLHVYIIYDLKYTDALVTEFKILDHITHLYTTSVEFIGEIKIEREYNLLIKAGVIRPKEANLIFGSGYAKKRNAALYFALKDKMDYLIFIDDDEYPVACIKDRNLIKWIGQSIVDTHLRFLNKTMLTHGYQCGYISPIPLFKYSESFTRHDFKNFIESISNDIVNFESIENKIKEGGITYADESIITNCSAKEVQIEKNNQKFISGSNLGINLKRFSSLPPFYTPPLARGEDTFFASCLNDVPVLRVPCYTFHDCYRKYTSILHGVLPQRLMSMDITSESALNRFFKACVGWIRYKPLFLYITRKNEFTELMQEIRKKLAYSAPKLAKRLKMPEFNTLINEFDKYRNKVQKHYEEFEKTKQVWSKIVRYLR